MRPAPLKREIFRGEIMKKLLLIGLLIVMSLSFMGCATGDPSHKDTFFLVTSIAVNHLEFEKSLALDKCAAEGVSPCDVADLEKWILALSTFKQHLVNAETLEIGAEEIDLIVNSIIAEMSSTDPRMRLYIMDIKAVLEMMLRYDETRVLTGRSPI